MKARLTAAILVPLFSGSLAAQTPIPAPVTTPPAPASGGLTAEQVLNIGKQLDLIESQITKNRTDALGTALARFRAAMGSERDALSLYLDCYKLENYDKRNLKQADFDEWKDRNEERLKNPDNMRGLQLQLEYLVLTIQAASMDDTSPLIPALQAFLQKAVVAVQETMKHNAAGAVVEKEQDRGPNRQGGRPGGGGRPPGGGGGGGGGGLNGQLVNMLRQSVTGTEYSRAYQLDEYLKNKEWENQPLEIAGIYNRVIFPYYEKNKPTELPAQWDARISTELALRKAVQSEAEFMEYYKENYPPLLWEKAKYLFEKNINPIIALADMLKIIRENPSHPRAQSWVDELRGYVKSREAPQISPNQPPAAATN